jgi:predicted DNA-binding ArsR family transcriptional regulator
MKCTEETTLHTKTITKNVLVLQWKTGQNGHKTVLNFEHYPQCYRKLGINFGSSLEED